MATALENARQRREHSLTLCRRAAGGPIPQLVPAAAINNSGGHSGNRQIAEAAEQLRHFRGQVFTSVRPIAQRVATQPIRVAKIAANSKGTPTLPRSIEDFLLKSRLGVQLKSHQHLELVDQHPALDAFHNPAPSAPSATEFALKYSLVTALEITGHAYLWMPTVNGRKEIWPIPPSWIWPEMGKGTFVEFWNFKPPHMTTPIQLPVEEVSFFMLPDPSNPLCGLGPLEAGARSVLVDEYVQDCIMRAFQVGVWPTALVKVNSQPASDGTLKRGRLSQWQMNQIREEFMARYAGHRHAGAPIFADGRMDIEPWGHAPNQMDFGMNAQATQERVEQTFGTPPYAVGASSLGSRAESGESDGHFVYNTINPLLELVSQVLTLCVLPKFDTSGSCVLFIEPAKPRDADMRQQQFSLGLGKQCVTINEYRREVLQLPAVEWGDAVSAPANVAIVPETKLVDGYFPPPPPDNSAPEGEAVPTGDVAATTPPAATPPK